MLRIDEEKYVAEQLPAKQGASGGQSSTALGAANGPQTIILRLQTSNSQQIKLYAADALLISTATILQSVYTWEVITVAKVMFLLGF